MVGDTEGAPTGFLGRSRAAEEIRGFVRCAARIDCTVLITGESGVGKELVAREIHDHSSRKDQIFFALNCSAIPESLFESEVFGHEAGAYTGANGVHRGAFELSQGGTLFLDEIGDLSLALQPKLLRVLDSHELLRVGGERMRPLDIRVIAATNHDLKDMCRQEKFREDLYYRLRVLEISVPPLRQRSEDIPDLVGHFMAAIGRKYGIEIPQLDSGSMDTLRKKPWPGNVRQLQHAVERAMAPESCPGGGPGPGQHLQDSAPSRARPASRARSLTASISNLMGGGDSSVPDRGQANDRRLSGLRLPRSVKGREFFSCGDLVFEFLLGELGQVVGQDGPSIGPGIALQLELTTAVANELEVRYWRGTCRVRVGDIRLDAHEVAH